MNRFSTTLLAMVFMTSPFLTGAFRFADDFEFMNIQNAASWWSDKLQDSVEKFYTSFDEDRGEDLVNQMDPNAEFSHYKQQIAVKDIPNHLAAQKLNHNYQTEIYKVILRSSKERNARVIIFGRVLEHVKNTDFVVFMSLIRNNDDKIKIKKFERVELDPECFILRKYMKASQSRR
ncbi:uncharacterized protein MELLADRAFT_123908 [Melampsora larici-populina 98AG31]|uniref:Secreted protein n=1 Tax=Melampsora larici-populina (strain 98AG31 / pathotype 3-4-7) TaxID=747676 RepID=F4R4V2_MELLP|nr:uncharacterized protein MELLADRAFT_123908 [Melampsora larici-populina 98AG31]EGG12935.1 secreted protein [Melampsora larici-populina 98AG31]